MSRLIATANVSGSLKSRPSYSCNLGNARTGSPHNTNGLEVKQRVRSPSSRFSRISSIPSIWFRCCFEITSSGAVRRRMDLTFSKPLPDGGCCDENRGFSRPSAGALDPRSLRKLRGKRRCPNIGARYSVDPLTCDFGEILKTRWSGCTQWTQEFSKYKYRSASQG